MRALLVIVGALLGASILYGVGASTVSAQSNLPPDWQDWDPELVGRYENDPRELQNLYSGSQELKNVDASNPTPTREYKRFGDQQTAKTVWKRAVESKAGSVLRAGGRVLGPASWIFFGYTLIKGDPSGCTTDIGKIIQTDPPVCAMGIPIDTTGNGEGQGTSQPFQLTRTEGSTCSLSIRGEIYWRENLNGIGIRGEPHTGSDGCSGSYIGRWATAVPGDGPDTTQNAYCLSSGIGQHVTKKTAVWDTTTSASYAPPINTVEVYALDCTPNAKWRYLGDIHRTPVEEQPGDVVEVGPMQPLTADPPAAGAEIPPNEMRDLYDFIRAQPEYTPFPADPDEQNDRWGAPVKSWENPDGSISTLYEDGTVVTRWPDGTIFIKYANGSEEWVRAKAPVNGVQQNPATIPFPNPGASPNPYPTPSPYPGVAPVPHPSPAPHPAPTPPITPPAPPGEELPPGPTDPPSPGCNCDASALLRPTVKYEEKFPFSLALYVRDLFQHASQASDVAPVFNLGPVGEVDLQSAHGTIKSVRAVSLIVFAGLICWVMYKVISARKV